MAGAQRSAHAPPRQRQACLPRQPWWRVTRRHDIVRGGAACARRRHAYGALVISQACVRPKPAVPWAPEAARRAFSAMVAAVRARHILASCVRRGYQATHKPLLTLTCSACTQAGRVLSVAVVAPGRHPLRALASADGAVPSLGPAWAELDTAADPVFARALAILAAGAEWQWTALPADYAHVVAESGLLRQSARLVALGGAYVASLRGRCANAAQHLPPPAHAPLRIVAHAMTRAVMRHAAVAGRRPAGFSARPF